MKYRHNPYIYESSEGYLYNPQYANEWAIGRDRYHLIDKDKVVLWVHATEYKGIADWFGKTLDEISKYKIFYVGGGANANEFGNHYVFVKYKPTRIFSGDTYFEDNPKEAERFLDCLVSKFDSNSSYFDIFDEVYSILPSAESIAQDEELDFSKLNHSELKILFREGLESLNYSFLENTYTQECLLEFGFTAYFETENYFFKDRGHYPLWKEVNLAILEPDFKNVEIVGTLSPVDPKLSSRQLYLCPRCGDKCSREKMIDSTFQMGEIMCEDCITAVECEICNKWTKESCFAETEKDRWGNVTIICTTCEEDRKCQYCEEYSDSELIEVKLENQIWETNICEDCHARKCEECNEIYDYDDIVKGDSNKTICKYCQEEYD